MKNIWLIDIDGTICEDIPNETPELFISAKPIPGALEKVLELVDKGDEICYFTARKSEHSLVTELWLNENGFPYTSVIYNKPRIKDGQCYNWIDNKPVRGHFCPQGLGKEFFND
jgi:hypothetical protein